MKSSVFAPVPVNVKRSPPALAPLVVMLSLAGCTQMKPPPAPLEYPRSPRATSEITSTAPSQRPTETSVAAMPGSPVQTAPAPTSPSSPAPGVTVSGEDISMAIEQTPLPTFVQILYGNVLKKAYSIDPAIAARTEMVTFKTSQPISRARMEQIAVNLLRSYGVVVQDYDGLVRLVPDSAPGAVTPQLRRGKTMGESSEPLRPVFQHVELDTVRSTDVAQWLKQILGTRVTATDDATRNGLLLSGNQADIRAALELIQSLDQPRMRGRVARRITPAYASPTDFTTRLTDVLTAQGYAVASQSNVTAAPILIIPIQAIGSVIVFTVSDDVMDHVLRWARDLDRPPTGQTSNALFTYAVKYADAQDLARTLGELLGGGGGSAPPPSSAAGGATASPARATTGSNRVVVNGATNTLIFRGTSADEYQQIMTLLRELDRPVKSALIEVTVAELSTGNTLELGLDWQLLGSKTGARDSITGTINRNGINGASFSFVTDAGRVLGAIRAAASNNRGRVLSNPRVVARNGETATIQVGSEVPVITSQQTTNTGGIFGGTGLISQVQYRSTGVILKVRPVINSGNRLDLEISQEVSNAASTTTGVSSSPTISTRKIETKMSLRDGSTIVLGGLIERRSDNGNGGVPLLKDIPLLGSLFRSQTVTGADNEMLIMITPYVINDDFEAEAITEAVQRSFGPWAQELKPARSARLLDDEPPPRPPQGRESSPPAPAADAVPPARPNGASSTNGSPAPSSPVAAPAPAARTPAPNDGVVTSRPQPAPTPAPVPAPPAPAGTQPPSGQPRAPSPPPPIQGGREVTDEKVKEEIRELMKRQR